MKTKLLYVLVSGNNDLYFEMMIMSAFTAKTRMPDCHICVLTDNKTADSLSASRKILQDKYTDEVVVETFDDALNAKHRSRYLKTNMRNLVKGDFLYIDSDTVIMQPLYEIDNFDFEFGAVLDGHVRVREHHYKWIVKRETSLYGYTISEDGTYFNGGVIYVK